ncbi:MAG: restriction endonuclease subunit S [Spirochaetota bacterium]
MTQQTQINKVEYPQVSELCDFRKGKKVNSTKEKTKDSVPYLLIDTLRGADPEFFTEDKNYTEAIPEDILIVADGANSGLVGTGVSGAVGSTILRIRLKVKDLDKDYLSYFLKSKFEEFNKDMKGTGIPHLKPKNMLESKIRKPSLSEQTLIVQEIEKQFTRLDASVKSLKSVKKKLEIYRKAVLKKAFKGELVKNIYYNKNKLIDEIEEFNNKKSGQDKTRRLPNLSFDGLKNIPSNWFFINAHKVCSSVRDGTHDSPKYVEKGFPLVTSKNLKNGKLNFSKIDFISQKDYEEVLKRSQVEIGDILFAMIGTTGNPVEIKEAPNFAIKNVGLFKNKEQRFLLTSYLKYWLDSPNYLKILESKKLIKGTTQKFIDLGTLRISPVPICSKEEQTLIVQEIESRFSVIDKIEQVVNESLEKSEKLRKSILKSAFEGKLVKMEGVVE